MMMNLCYATIHLLNLKSSLPIKQNQKYDKVGVGIFLTAFSSNFRDLCIILKKSKIWFSFKLKNSFFMP